MIELALKNDYSLKSKKIVIREKEALLRLSGGDARRLYNLIELVVQSADTEPIVVDNEIVMARAQEKLALYDKGGEQHYDIISAFIKSMRGSDPHAAVYWLARMIEGGEKPEFIARRLIIFASEDIGLANPNALLLANACFDAIHKIGWPEGRIILSQTTVYLALCQKSNSTYQAINKAQELVQKTGDLGVPLHLRNAPTRLMKELGYGKEYQYPHSFDNHFVKEEYLPPELKGSVLWQPSDNQKEKEMAERLKRLWEKKK